MGSIEEAAEQILADRQKHLNVQDEHFTRRDAALNVAIDEFLELAVATGFPMESTYRASSERHGNQGFYERDVKGWVVRTETPGEYDSGVARGVLITADRKLRRFTAEGIHHIPGHGPRDASPFYKAYPYVTRTDVFILLSSATANSYEINPETLAECAAFYIAAVRGGRRKDVNGG